MTTFYIVRHGETEWNIQGRVQGHGDSPLTVNGELQAKKVADKLKNIHFDLAFSSDLLRAKRTAEVIAKEHKLEVVTTKLLREKDFGTYEGTPYAAFKAFDDLFETLSETEKFTFKGHESIESDEEIVGRFITFLRETALTHPAKTILVGTHGAMMRVLLVHLGYGTYKQLSYSSVGNGAHIVLESDGIDFFIKDVEGVQKKETN